MKVFVSALLAALAAAAPHAAVAQQLVALEDLPNPDVRITAHGRLSTSFEPDETIRRVYLSEPDAWRLDFPESGARVTVEPASGRAVIPDTEVLVITRLKGTGQRVYLFRLTGRPTD